MLSTLTSLQTKFNNKLFIHCRLPLLPLNRYQFGIILMLVGVCKHIQRFDQSYTYCLLELEDICHEESGKS